MARRAGSKAYRDQQRERLMRLGVNGRQLIERLVADLMRCGCRPREAWRFACELTQDEVATRFNQIRDDPDIRMRGSRICEYEKWPMGGVRPSVRALKILAAVYGTTWDQLVDVDDLDQMPPGDRQAFISDLHYDAALDFAIPPQRRQCPSVFRGTDDSHDPPITVETLTTGADRLSISPPGRSSERLSGGLPGEITHFTGRDEPMIELRARIEKHTSRGTVVAIYAIDGMAGVGKTAFARHAAHQFAEHYPDGAIWVDLYGHTPGMPPREPSSALEQVLLQLGVSPEAIKNNLIERQDQWRHHVHLRRMLIVLDNALNSDQVLPLLPEAPGCLVLITSRRKLTGLTDAYPLSLDVLSWEEAEQLFIKLVGEQRCEDRNAVRQILGACGRLPLAIRLIAGRLRHHRGELLAEVAADLTGPTAALDAFAAEHLSVRAAFEWSYRLLTNEQCRAFRLLGWHPGSEITPVVITALADVPLTQGRQLLRELVDHNLLDQLSATSVPGGPRYRMHDLMRLYARERADAEEPLTERAAAVDRLAASYLSITRKADRLLRPYAAASFNESSEGEAVLTFADAWQARSWLAVERPNLLGCVRVMGPTTEAAALATVLAVHFRDFGFWRDVQNLYSQASHAYRHLGDRRGEAEALCGLGEVEHLVGEYGQAREYYSHALTIACDLGEQGAETDALRGLGHIKRHIGEYDQAREYYSQALAVARHLGEQRAETDALRGLGLDKWLVGEYDQAREYYSQALAVARHIGYEGAEADALCGLGDVAYIVGEYDQAREYYSQALAVARHLGEQRAEANALRGLGHVKRRVGTYDQARHYYSQALVLVRRLGDRFGEVLTLRGLGDVEQLVGEHDQAHENYSQALLLARHLGDRHAEAEALSGLGHVASDIGKHGQARELWRKALEIYQELGVPHANTVRAAMRQLDDDN